MGRFRNRRGDREAGMALLLDSDHRNENFGRVYRQATRCKQHPFGLDVPPDDVRLRIMILPRVSSNNSVDDLAAVIRWSCATGGPTRLRVITVRDTSPMHERRFYFEIWFRGQVFIGGNCTYFSDGGGSATQAMRSMFLVLSTVYGVDIEEETIIGEQVMQVDADMREALGLRTQEFA